MGPRHHPKHSQMAPRRYLAGKQFFTELLLDVGASYTLLWTNTKNSTAPDHAWGRDGRSTCEWKVWLLNSPSSFTVIDRSNSCSTADGAAICLSIPMFLLAPQVVLASYRNLLFSGFCGHLPLGIDPGSPYWPDRQLHQVQALSESQGRRRNVV